MKRFWMSWIVSDDDHRPLTYPPNNAILGWWCTGYDGKGNAMLCGLVRSENEESAKHAVLQDWPGIEWRFIEEKPADFIIKSDRFPLSDWMGFRLAEQN